MTLTNNFVIMRRMLRPLRQLTKPPGPAAVALVTLALGIGAPTATFSVIYAVVLRPLPYPEPDRVVTFRIETRDPRGAAVGFDAVPAATALEWQASTSTLAAMALFSDRALTLSTPDGPFRLTGVAATPDLFRILNVPPLAGRGFESGAGDAREIVLSHATWRRFFVGHPSVVGSSITLNGEPYRVNGVMPPDFHFPTPEAAFWVPMRLESGGSRGMLLPAVARLRAGATLPAVVAEGRAFFEDAGRSRDEFTLVARTLQEQLIGNVRRLLWVLMGAVTFVAVIATANIALLLLVRGAAREREFSVRLALGAGRGQLVRQLLAEGTALAIAGGAAGLVLAVGLLALLPRLAPADMPRLQDAALNGPVVAFAVAVTAGTSLVFWILSAGRTIAVDPLRALLVSGSESRLVTAATPRRRVTLLASAELALTLVLLAGAGLLLRSFVSLVLVDQGFHAGDAVALQVSLPPARYPTAEARLAFHERLLDQLKRAGDVHIAGLTTAMPNRQPSGRYAYNPNELPVLDEPMSMHVAEVRMTSEGFFEAMGIPLRAGRTFRPEDGPGAEPVMMISESLARLHFPDRDPIGQLLYSHTGTRRVVGVVGDVRPAVTLLQHSPAAYLPIRQETRVFEWYAGMNVVVRGRDPRALTTSLRTLILSLDPEMPPFNVRTLDEEVSRLVAGPRFSASVLAVFAMTALVLASVGVYGVMAYLAGQRTREIGVRIAIGATRSQVLRHILRDGVVVVGTGLVTGLVASLWLAQALTGLLHEVQPTDPIALALVAAVLSSVGLLAAYLPARRATRVNAVDALRSD